MVWIEQQHQQLLQMQALMEPGHHQQSQETSILGHPATSPFAYLIPCIHAPPPPTASHAQLLHLAAATASIINNGPCRACAALASMVNKCLAIVCGKHLQTFGLIKLLHKILVVHPNREPLLYCLDATDLKLSEVR